LDLHGRLHLEEGEQVGEEERLVGDARGGGEDLLQVGAGLLIAVVRKVKAPMLYWPWRVRQMTKT
jgi:hypothetical protein